MAYDKCYHQGRDTIANINDKALAINSRAILTAAATYGYSTNLPGTGTPTTPAPGTGGGGDDHDHGVPM